MTALLHLLRASEHLRYCSARTRRMFTIALARVMAWLAIQRAARA